MDPDMQEQARNTYEYRQRLINELYNGQDSLEDFITPSGDYPWATFDPLVDPCDPKTKREFEESMIYVLDLEERLREIEPTLHDQFTLLQRLRHRHHGIDYQTTAGSAIVTPTRRQAYNLFTALTISRRVSRIRDPPDTRNYLPINYPPLPPLIVEMSIVEYRRTG